MLEAESRHPLPAFIFAAPVSSREVRQVAVYELTTASILAIEPPMPWKVCGLEASI